MILKKIVAMLAIYGKILIEKSAFILSIFLIYTYTFCSSQECIDLFLIAGVVYTEVYTLCTHERFRNIRYI